MDETVTGEVETAYDGSNTPPKRELTALERDVICRVLGDLLYLYMREGEVPVRGFDNAREVRMFMEIPAAISPRADDQEDE